MRSDRRRHVMKKCQPHPAGAQVAISKVNNYSQCPRHPLNLRKKEAEMNRTLIVLCFIYGVAAAQTNKLFFDFFKPTPIVHSPLTRNIWGAVGVIPRDSCNGLEDRTGTQSKPPAWLYWDGVILRANNGKYHMFSSRWAQSGGMNGWVNSNVIHATSDSLIGPYTDQGYAYNNGPAAGSPNKGHNVSALALSDGTYALYVSEIVPFTIFTATSLDGPWANRGHAIIDTSGIVMNFKKYSSSQPLESNISIMARPDGNYELIQRHGLIAISTSGVLGPYKLQKPTTSYPANEQPPSDFPTIYPNRQTHLTSEDPTAPSGVPENTYVLAEDPCIWYSGGQYHVLYDYPDDRVGYHLTSQDGIHNWTDQGFAFDPRQAKQLFSYTDDTIEHWYKMERPSVYMENGHIKYFTFALTDVDKSNVTGGSDHGTCVAVMAFDGATFDEETGISGVAPERQRTAVRAVRAGGLDLNACRIYSISGKITCKNSMKSGTYLVQRPDGAIQKYFKP